MNKIIMRTLASIAGLEEMIQYINQITPTKKMRMAEIGVFEGDATIIFSNHFKTVHAVDPWDFENMNVAGADPSETYHNFLDNIKGRKNTITLLETSKAAASNLKYDKPFNLVYIDAIHTYNAVKEDIELWLPLISPGGFISGHDYAPKFAGVQKAVDEKFGRPDQIFSDTSWIVRVK